MPDYTTNYKLKKPLPEEFYNIEDFNGNADIIDKTMHDVVASADKKLTATIEAVEMEIESLNKDVADKLSGVDTTVDTKISAVENNVDKKLTGFKQTVDEMLLTGAKIETGSYVGNGTYGKDNPNSLTFGFEPKVVWIIVLKYQRANSDGGTGGNPYSTEQWSHSYAGFWTLAIGDSYKNMGYTIDCMDGRTHGYDFLTSSENGYFAKVADKTLSWYATDSDDKQFNELGETYHYIAIG